jgi:ABC-type glycerol-3-phosphate transport system substrate-binding protein
MQLMGQWKVIDIDKYAREGFDYGVVPLPYPPGGRKKAHMQNCSGYGLIPKGTPHPKEALKFLFYWNGYPSTPEIIRDRAKIMVAGGWMPLAETVWEHPIVIDYLKKFPAFKAFADILRAETTRVLTTPAQAYYIDRLTVAEDKARLLQVTPKQALDTCTVEVQKELDRILKREK